MLEIDRRSFLALSAATGFLKAYPIAAAPHRHILWGDGKHDDTEALQTLLSGGPVLAHPEIVAIVDDKTAFLRHGFFVLTDSLRPRAPVKIDIQDCTFWMVGGKPVFDANASCGGSHIQFCRFSGHQYEWPGDDDLSKPCGWRPVFDNAKQAMGEVTVRRKP